MEQRLATKRPATRHNLPAEVASFVGRTHALAEVERLLTAARLLTITGAGGCGKTRLALRAAAEVVPRFPDGAWLVELAPLSDSALVPRGVAATLGVQESADRPLLATIAAAVGTRRLLLVLDNCEHLLGATARLVEALLRACPHLRILATSREPLHVAGEVAWRVPPLALPDMVPGTPPSTPDTLNALAQVESVALFLDRARARLPDFALTAENASVVAAICRHLEGLPLGIELAAARMGALDPQQIAARFDDSLRLLAGGNLTLPRHEALRATLDWSHALLSQDERVFFRRLAVFAGSFSVAAAERVAGGEGVAAEDALGLLLALIEKSLVEPVAHPGETRYRLLEPIRQYAAGLLAADEEMEGMRRRHATYFVAFAEAAEPGLMSGERGPWMARLASEQDNLRATLTWCRDQTDTADSALGLRLASALFWFWSIRGAVNEGQEWMGAALARAPTAPPALRAKGLHAAGELAWLAGHSDLARRRLEESATLYRELGDRRGLAYTLQALPMVLAQPHAVEVAAESLRHFEEIGDSWGAAHAALTLATLALVRGDDPMARAQLEAALARWRRLGDDWGIAQALNFLGDLARDQGDDARATTCYQESLALLRRQGITGTVPSLLHNLGYLALRGGGARRALRLFRASLELFRDQGDQRGIAECLAGLAGALGMLRKPERSARLFGAAGALNELTGAAIWPANARDYARNLATTRAQLDGAAFAAAWEAGRALSLAGALAEALAVDPPEPSGAPLGDEDGAGLTAREREVAALVARGLTNRQIGATLVITEGTARLHVKRILHKLGFASRARIAAWAVARGLGASSGASPDA